VENDQPWRGSWNLSPTILSAAGAKAIRAQDRPSRLWFERDAVRLAALITNDLEALAFAATASLFWAPKTLTACVAARLAALRVT
jgi:hypothetical protein